jgi:diguanylate cyclase (GGDEF)-like protein
LLLMTLLSSLCWAGTGDIDVRHRFFNVPSFAGQSVRALLEEPSGLLWVGSSEGLFWFDGKQASPVGNIRANVYDLHLAADRLWIAGADGIYQYRHATDRVTRLRCHGQESVLSGGAHQLVVIAENLYALTRSGLLDVNACKLHALPEQSQQSYVERPHVKDGALWYALRDRGLWRCVWPCATAEAIAPTTLANLRVQTITDLDQRRLLVGTHRHGLFALDHQNSNYTIARRWYRDDQRGPSSLPTNGVLTALSIPASTLRPARIWAGLWAGGLVEIGASTELSVAIPDQVGLDVLSRSRLVPYEPLSFASDVVFELLHASNDTLYIGHDRGLSMLDPQAHRIRWLGARQKDVTGLPKASVQALHVDHQGRSWIASSRGGLSLLSADRRRLQVFESGDQAGLPSSAIWSFAEHPSSPWIWMGSSNGLLRAHADRLEFDSLTTGLPSDDVISLHFAPDGSLWIAMWAGGVAQIDPQGKLLGLWRSADGLRSDNNSEVFISREGEVFVLNEIGAHVLNAERRFEPLKLPSGVGDVPNAIAQSRSGAIWLSAGDRGLLRRGPEAAEFHSLTLPAELQGQKYFALQADLDSGVLVSSSAGLHVFAEDGSLLTTTSRYAEVDPSCLSVAKMAQLKGVPVVGRPHAGAKQLLLGGACGLLWMDDPHQTPAQISKSFAPQITKVRLFNQALDYDQVPGSRAPLAGGPLMVRYDQDLLSFEFTQPGWPQPSNQRYRYQLKGFDRDWLDATPDDLRATYTRLPPGQFELQLQVSVGNIAADVRLAPALMVEVQPPWWMRWWARLSALGAILALLYAGYRYRVVQLKHVAKVLELRVQERTRELAAANASLKQAADCDGLTGVLNRRGFRARVQSAIDLAVPHYVWLADIDHFKLVNDRYGHRAGDQVLVLVADRISAVPGVLALGRWGGEEFVAILSDVDVAEHIRMAIAEPTQLGDGPEQVTLSAGLVAMQNDLDRAIGAADQLLYQAKRAGRNRVEFSAELDGKDNN